MLVMLNLHAKQVHVRFARHGMCILSLQFSISLFTKPKKIKSSLIDAFFLIQPASVNQQQKPIFKSDFLVELTIFVFCF